MNETEENLKKLDFEFLQQLKKSIDEEFQKRLNKNYVKIKKT